MVAAAGVLLSPPPALLGVSSSQNGQDLQISLLLSAAGAEELDDSQSLTLKRVAL